MRGAAANDGAFLISSFRWIPEKTDNGQIYFSLSGKLARDLAVGLDYRPLTDDVGFLGTWRAISETDTLPALIIGTSTDDFTDDGREVKSQTLYATLSKYFFSVGGVEVAPYSGAAWIHELDDLRPLAGLNLRYDSFSTLLQYSGTDTHLSVSYRYKKTAISFIHWGLKYPGLAITQRF